MILQALYELYERLKDTLPPMGFEEKPIPFIIALNEHGTFINLEDNHEQINDKFQPRVMRVPKAKSRSGAKSYETAFCLWDHYGYIAAQAKVDKPTSQPSEKDQTMADKQHAAFKRRVADLVEALPDDTGVLAVHRFLSQSQQISALKNHPLWADVLKIKGCNLSFRLCDCSEQVCASPNVIEWVKAQPPETGDIEKGVCLVTGQSGDVVRLHDNVVGVAQKPAPFASINDTAYCSFGKEKGFNFPVSPIASFRYTTALNHLLRKNSQHKFRVGDATYVCWSEKETQVERTFIQLFADEDDVTKAVDQVKHLFNSIHNGAYTGSDGKQRFYILGLAPNSARIVTRFWQVGTVASVSENIAEWFTDLQIQGFQQYGYPPLKKLLRSTALQYKDDNIPPNLPADAFRSIINGTALPETLAQGIIRRIKAEKGAVTYTRAALIKAWLIRLERRAKNKNQGMTTMSLNEKDNRVGYCLGRLFAVLENLQRRVQPNLNATIRDRYYSSASCSPVSVFGTLMRLSGHHQTKLRKETPGLSGYFDNRIGGIMEMLEEGFPAHLNLEQQGLFAIGYYHEKYHRNAEKEESRTEEQGDVA